MAPVCSNCGGTEFVWAGELKTGGRLGQGPLALRSGGEMPLGTRVCRECGHADLFLRDVTVLKNPHQWRPGEFVPISSPAPAHHGHHAAHSGAPAEAAAATAAPSLASGPTPPPPPPPAPSMNSPPNPVEALPSSTVPAIPTDVDPEIVAPSSPSQESAPTRKVTAEAQGGNEEPTPKKAARKRPARAKRAPAATSAD